MEGVSIIIPVLNKLEMTENCINHIKKFNTKCIYEIIVFDNGSTDSTQEVLSNNKGIVYIRSHENLGLSKAYNFSYQRARYDVLCFMHNDVFVYEEGWIDRIRSFISQTPKAGIVGLYGAKTIRKDGSFRGKTIIHSKRYSPSIKKAFEKVAVVDGLLIAVKKDAFEKITGFNEEFSIHYYDKDISMRAMKNNFDNYVLNIPFEHFTASTRKKLADENKIRGWAQKRFVEIWSNLLPFDVSTWKEKVSYMLMRAL